MVPLQPFLHFEVKARHNNLNNCHQASRAGQTDGVQEVGLLRGWELGEINHQRFYKNIQQSKDSYREEAKERQWKLGGLDSYLPSPDQTRT